MTQSLYLFNQALGEAEELLSCYEKLNSNDLMSPPSALKKASLILTLTAWETYVEDAVKELFEAKFSLIKGSKLGDFAQKQLDEKLKFFHNPNSRKTKHLFEEFFGVDVTEQWEWNNVYPKDAREQLNSWINLRGEAVHRATTDLSQPQVINKKDLEKCLRFFRELAKVTDKVLEEL